MRKQQDLEAFVLQTRQEQWVHQQQSEAAVAQAEAKARQAEDALMRERLCKPESSAIPTISQIQDMIATSIQQAMVPMMSQFQQSVEAVAQRPDRAVSLPSASGSKCNMDTSQHHSNRNKACRLST